jgi:hypothetical protein
MDGIIGDGFLTLDVVNKKY